MFNRRVLLYKFEVQNKVWLTFFLIPSSLLSSLRMTAGRNLVSAACSCSSVSADPIRRNTRSTRPANRNTNMIFEPRRDKTNKMACAPREDSDQPGHPPSLIRVFAVRMKKDWVLHYPLSAQRKLWSDWADAQADLSLRWAHMLFCCFSHEAAHLHLNANNFLYSQVF